MSEPENGPAVEAAHGEALLSAGARALDILESISDGFVVLDREWRIVYLNEEAARYLPQLGRTREELLGRNLWEEFPELVGTPAHHELDRAVRGGVPVEYELHYPPLDRWFACRAQPTGTGVVHYSHEITERKRVEHRLEQAEQLFAELGHNLTDVLWVFSVEKNELLYVSRAYETIWGRSCASLFAAPRSFVEAIHPEDQERVLQALKRQVAGERTEETYRVCQPDGTVRWVLDRGFPVCDETGKIARVFGIARDITERKASEELMQLQSRVLDDMHEGVSVANEQGFILYTNPAEDEMFGYERGELLGQHVTVQNAYPPEENERIVRQVIEHLERQGRWTGEWLNRKKDGTPFVSRSQITALEAGGGKHWVCVQEDVTEARQAREALRESGERLALALEAAHLGDWHWEAATDVVSFSQRVAEIFGIPPGQDMTWTEMQGVLHPEDRDRARHAVEQAVAENGQYDIEYRVLRRDGTQRWVSAKGRAIYDANGLVLGMHGVVQDVTAQKHAVAALRLSEERYRSLIAATTAIVWTADPEGRFVDPQPAWEAYTDQAWEEHQGFGWLAAIHPDDREKLLQTWRGAVAAKSLYAAEGRMWNAPMSQYRHFAVSAVPLLNPDGAVREWIGYISDVHEQRRAEEQLRDETRTIETINRVGQVLAGELDLQKLLQALTEAATEISDAEFGSFFYNTVGEQGEAYMLYTLSGVPREAFSKFPMPRNTEIFAPTFAGQGVVRLDDVTQDPRFGKNAPYYGMPEGHLPVRSYLALPVVSRTGEVLGGLFFGHSRAGVFTPRHERILTAIAAQAAIAIDNARLYKAAQDAAFSAQQHAQELADANRRKDEFISMLSHELRNPLAAISNAAGVLQQLGPQEERLVRFRQIIVRQTQNLTHIVNDLLDVSRLIHGRIELQRERLELSTVITRAVEACRGAIDARGHQFRLSTPLEPVELEADPTRLEQIVCNLLDNAAKYTEPGGRINLTVEREESEGNDWVVLRVTDTGIGMPAELLPQVFELFTQAERSLDRSQGGLGIGLTVVLQLVELHGGTIQAFSDGPGRGSEFVIRLPAIPASRLAKSQKSVVEPIALPPLRVLVVDDLVDAAETLAQLVEVWGPQVKVAYDGREAVEIAAQFQPDVVLLDIGLPGWDGFEVARRLKELPNSGRTSIVAVTGYGQLEDVRRTQSAGFAAHLTKPVDLAQLHRLLSGLPLQIGHEVELIEAEH